MTSEQKPIHSMETLRSNHILIMSIDPIWLFLEGKRDTRNPKNMFKIQVLAL